MSLTDVIDAVRGAVDADPKNAAASFTVTSEHVSGTATEVDVVARKHEFTVDEPAALGGGDAGANPVELALAALGSCQVITYRFWAAKLGVRVDSIKVTTRGELDLHGFFGIEPGARAGFVDVRVDVELTGPEPAERYQELRRVADEHCPVLDLFRNPTPTTTVLTSG